MVLLLTKTNKIKVGHHLYHFYNRFVTFLNIFVANNTRDTLICELGFFNYPVRRDAVREHIIANLMDVTFID